MPARLVHSLLVLSLHAAGPAVAAAVRPSAARSSEVAGWLPERPAPVGAPASDRAAWATLAARLPVKEILAEADRLAPSAPPAVTDDLYLGYSRTGSRTAYETVYNSRRDRLTTFAWAEAIDGRGRYLSALQRDLDAILDERAWTLPAHDAALDNFYGRVVEVDLGAAMRGWSVATVAGWFGADLGAARLARLQSELRRRIIDPYLNAVRNGPRGGFWWLNSNSNWNAVCHAGIGGTALAALPDRALRGEVLAAAEANLPTFVSGFSEDGYCSEGVGYWSYGFGHHVLLAEAVQAATGGRLRLVDGPKQALVTAYPAGMQIQSRVYPAFADNAPSVQPAAWVAPLARRLLAGATAPARLPAAGWTEVARDQLYISAVRQWTPSVAVTADPPEPQLRHWFDQAQVLVTRLGDDFGAAVKGGHNDELHNHNDLGSYVVAVAGTPVLADPGSEVYTARTFSAQRYDSKVLNSYGHPVPRVAGRLQGTGRQFAARVLATEWTRDRDLVRLDLRGAYDVPALVRLEREFAGRRGVDEGFSVADTFEFSSPQAFGTALVTFEAWRQVDASTLEVGTGAAALRVRIRAEGGEVTVRAETLDENLPGGRKPVRIGIDFTAPLLRGGIRLDIRRAAPLLAAGPGEADASPAVLANLSTLAPVRPAEGPLIAGFTLAGSGRRTVLLRAVGPGLRAYGIAAPLGDPALILRSTTGEVARNEDWTSGVAAVAARVGAFPLTVGSADAALALDLEPGGYTAEVAAPAGSAGPALVELYDAGGGTGRLVNLSTRVRISAGSPLTLGLVVAPGRPRWFLLRGVGPALSAYGVGDALADPGLSLFAGDGRMAGNEDWSGGAWATEVEVAAASVGAFPLPWYSADAALVVQLPPGNYTFQVGAKGSATGTVLGEAYELP